ncbi:MAG: 4-alpha-glucanotransferase [Enterocloster asparagiformis]|nr:4-alpha-glucanotransferase [Enterocloster asparagiformis]
MRECGMLLPIASLPSRYGIGAFSKEAYEFVDTLKAAGQSCWQILPLGPTGYGDSPYQPFSAFAGNPYFIDLDRLVEEGLLTLEECEAVDFGEDPRKVWYDKIYEGRFPLLRKAYERFKGTLACEDDGAAEENAGAAAERGAAENTAAVERVHDMAARLLGDETREYCFYMAVKNHFGEQSWNLWDEDIRMRRPEAVARWRQALTDDIGFYEFQQIKFEEQWERLKGYANSQGIRLVGDIPIYVAFDGADSWAHPELFQFDEKNEPVAVAGCPPDAFAATGQLWGNPLYNWEYHRQTGYDWWMKRMAYSFKLYDQVRVDHFRGFDAYYSIPYGDPTAEFGHWEPGPGIEIFRRMQEVFGKKLPIIAEDLGFLTPSVRKLLTDTGFPGMKVLEFAFNSKEESDYLPYNYNSNCVVYTGTHDNDTLVGWYKHMEIEDKEFSMAYLGSEDTPLAKIHWDFIRLALSSVARLAVIPVQDYLGLGSEARVNEPSTLGKNWRWRMLHDELDGHTIRKCRRLAKIYGRLREEPEKENAEQE